MYLLIWILQKSFPKTCKGHDAVVNLSASDDKGTAEARYDCI